MREHDWNAKHEFAFTHDLARHRKAAGQSPTLPPPVAAEDVTPNAVVLSHSGQWAFVELDGQEVLCLIHDALGERTSTVLAPGDLVQVDYTDEQPFVRGVAPRRSKLSRLAHFYSTVSEQVIAANIDVLVIVASSAKPRFKPGLIDRYLIVAQAGGVEPLLVMNKMDLAPEPEQVQAYREVGLRVIGASCVSGQGIEELREALQNKLGVMAGHSGVGKSSLLNTIDPALQAATREVSELTEKGKHTTSAARLHHLCGGIRVIDTPGIKTLGLWKVEPEDLSFYFPEMAEVAHGCRFRNCRHLQEPDCAVHMAVERNEISRLRYESYKRIREDMESQRQF